MKMEMKITISTPDVIDENHEIDLETLVNAAVSKFLAENEDTTWMAMTNFKSDRSK